MELAAAMFANDGDRRSVYVMAGEILEAGGRLDEAVAAYQGRL